MTEQSKDKKSSDAKKPDAPASPAKQSKAASSKDSVASNASSSGNSTVAAYSPSPALLNAQSASALLKSVDGPSLVDYTGKESIYVGRKVPVAAGADLKVPIQVIIPGSLVEYAVEINAHDIGILIRAEREEGGTTVREYSRITNAQSPLTQKFLVGSVPCQLQFVFDNTYSWMREKTVSYKITITPPSLEALQIGRRRRAQSCLQAVQDDLSTATQRLEAASAQKATLQHDIAQLMQELEAKKKAWQVAEKEEAWLLERKALRLEQETLLQERLQEGWPDENEEKANEKITSEKNSEGKKEP